MDGVGFDVVTGACGFTGKYIATKLIESGKWVLNLTGHPARLNICGERMRTLPFQFDKPKVLRRNLEGANAVFNTYWIRFPRGPITYDLAVRNTLTLINAAAEAGVQRLVHVSIANASEDSPYAYYRGKAAVEKAIRESGISYAIIRPTVLFGYEGILLNNIAWLLRKFPVFGIPGRGDYSIQPVFVNDLADMAVDYAGKSENIEADAAGPETFTFNELIESIKKAVGSSSNVVHVPPFIAYLLTRFLGYYVHDVVLTKDEILGLADGLLASGQPPLCKTPLSSWLKDHASTLGTEYFSELGRHYR